MKGSKSHRTQIRELNEQMAALLDITTNLEEDVIRLKREQGRNDTRITVALTHLNTVLRWAYAWAKAQGDEAYLSKLLVAGRGVASCFSKTQ